jgi:death-on-curing protein
VTTYPSAEEVLATHARLIELFGGSHGVRDRGALDSALFRPRSGYYRDIIEEAAALLKSRWQNHPLIDGNKRTAVSVAAAFLSVNGYRLEFDDLEAYVFLIGLVEAGHFRFDEFDCWLRAPAQPPSR